MSVEQVKLRDQRDQALRDLAELDQQVAAGDIDPETARRLQATYREELEYAQRALSELEASPETSEPPGRSRRRMVAGAAILVASFVGIVVMAGSFLVDREDSTLQGVAAGGDELDLDEVSNATLEAVIATNADNPMINGMRLALGERYFQERLYQDAFPHFQAVLDNDPSPAEAGEALSRLGWMVYDGNNQVDLSRSLLQRSLEARPGDPFTTYLLARVTWCGAGEPEVAVPLLESVLATEGLDPEVAETVEADLAIARVGGACP